MEPYKLLSSEVLPGTRALEEDGVLDTLFALAITASNAVATGALAEPAAIRPRLYATHFKVAFTMAFLFGEQGEEHMMKVLEESFAPGIEKIGAKIDPEIDRVMGDPRNMAVLKDAVKEIATQLFGPVNTREIGAATYAVMNAAFLAGRGVYPEDYMKEAQDAQN